MRIAALLLLLSFCVACGALRYEYDPPEAEDATPASNFRIGVLPFQIAEAALAAHPGSPEIPEAPRQLGHALARAARASGRFRAVVFLADEPMPESTGQWRALAARYGVDGFLVGELRRLAYEARLPFWAVVPPVAASLPLGILGIPLMPYRYDADVRARVRLVSGASGATCWASDELRGARRRLARVSWHSRAEKGVELHRQLLDALFDDIIHEVRLFVGRSEMSALRGPVAAPRGLSAEAQPTSRTFRRRFALVVGISQYEHAGRAGLENLTWADDDARAFARTLVDAGWRPDDIRVLTDERATRRNLERAVEGWLGRAGRDDLVVLYWAGHGYASAPRRGEVCFVCHDTDLASPSNGWRMDRALRAIRRANPRNALVVADVCHADHLVKLLESKPARGATGAEKLEGVPAGWLFFLGARGDRQAAEHARWGGGLLTRCMIEGLAGKADTDLDGRVNMAELRRYVQAIMPAEGRTVLGRSCSPVIFSDRAGRRIWDLCLSPWGWEEDLDDDPAAWNAE